LIDVIELVTLPAIEAAAGSIAGVAVRTPLLSIAGWPRLRLKPESLQPIGAFKIRGAVHAVACLPDAARQRGVITHSSGNHGQALAYAAARSSVPCVVVMPDAASPMKIEAVRALGAEVVLVPPAEREHTCAALAQERGLSVVPPYDHPDIIAGQGTVGLEIAAEGVDLAAVLVPVGGGGLASGVAAALAAKLPHVAVIGVEPELAADAAQSLQSGHVVSWPPEQTYRTVADGLRTNLSELTFAHLKEHLAGIATVTEDEIMASVATLARRARLVVEPSGAVAAAAWLHHGDDLQARFAIRDGTVAAVVSGGNIDPALLRQALAGARDSREPGDGQPATVMIQAAMNASSRHES
jgi:threonine dehydratase